MKAEDVRENATYKVRVGKGTVVGTVRKVTAIEETRDDGKKARTQYTYEVVESGSRKVHVVRSPSYFLEEVVKKPAKGDHVKIVVGVHKDSLDAKRVYRVKSVGPKNVVIVSGKKEHRVPTTDIRVVESEGEKRPDPTTKKSGEKSMTRFTSGSVLSGKRPTTNTTPLRDGPVSEPKFVTGSVTAPPVPSSVSEGADPLDWCNDKPPEWCEAAIAAGYDENNLPPVGWEPETAEVRDLIAMKESGNVRVQDVAKSVIDNRTMHERQVDDETGFEGEIPTYARTPFPQQLRAIDTSSPLQKRGLAARLGAQQRHRDDSPHLIVEARAGTGKTTTLIEGFRIVLGQESKLTPSPQQKAVWDAMALSKGKVDSICFVAFNKSIATELQSRVPPGACAMTMHSMGFKAVQQAFGRNIKVESYRVGNILSELLEEDIRDLRKRKFDVMKAVEDLVGLCKMNLVVEPDRSLETGMTHDEQLDKLASHYEVEIADKDKEEVYELVPRVLERCKDVRADGEIDFNDMIWLPVALDLKVMKYDLLLVDEAQDLNRCQQALAKKAGHRLILCGDPKQAIYGFAGADSESMDRMYRELDERHPLDFVNKYGAGTDGMPMLRGCARLPLTVTRRCGKAIVAEAQKIVPDFDAFETNCEGRVSRMKYPDGVSKLLTEEERRLNPDYSSSVQDGDFILCRCNAPLVSQCFRFLKQGRKATIQGRDIGQGLVNLVKKFRAVDVTDLVRQLSDWYFAEQKKENAKRNPSEAKLIALGDKYDCLIAFTENMKTVGEVIAKIESVFVDNKDAAGIKLSSIHRAKGLEAKRVFFLMPEGASCPHPMAKSTWQVEQEWNLKYVAVTRAIEELIFVT